jgi:hypothetical protein
MNILLSHLTLTHFLYLKILLKLLSLIKKNFFNLPTKMKIIKKLLKSFNSRTFLSSHSLFIESGTQKIILTLIKKSITLKNLDKMFIILFFKTLLSELKLAIRFGLLTRQINDNNLNNLYIYLLKSILFLYNFIYD